MAIGNWQLVMKKTGAFSKNFAKISGSSTTLPYICVKCFVLMKFCGKSLAEWGEIRIFVALYVSFFLYGLQYELDG